MQIDIAKGFRQYSPEELFEAAYKGTLACGACELGDFLEYLMQGVQEKIDNAFEQGKEAAELGEYDQGYHDAVEDMREKLNQLNSQGRFWRSTKVRQTIG